jgi:hypothetical protein
MAIIAMLAALALLGIAVLTILTIPQQQAESAVDADSLCTPIQ